MKYLLYDFSNFAHRSFHIVDERDEELRKQYIMGGLLTFIYDIYCKIQPDKNVYIFDSNSWRKKINSAYKANRETVFGADLEGKELIFNIISTFYEFIKNTNAYALKVADAESDDLISVFIENHPDDEIVIASTDTDFYQLVSDKVSIYSPITRYYITNNVVYDEDMRPVPFKLDNNGKLKIEKDTGLDLSEISPYGTWQEWCLFCKIIRGDLGDNIFSAYPGVRTKSTKKAVGILEAFKGRKQKDYNYVNFVNQTWEDHEGNTKLVESCMAENDRLINLKHIDKEYHDRFDKYIKEYESNYQPKKGTGILFGKFCMLHHLDRLIDNIEQYMKVFS